MVVLKAVQPEEAPAAKLNDCTGLNSQRRETLGFREVVPSSAKTAWGHQKL